MYRFAAILLSIVLLLLSIVPAQANRGPGARSINWNQQDTATYVVSTLNLLHTTTGQSIPSMLKSKLKISRFSVYEDTKSEDLYSIVLLRANGNHVGALVYVMGWSKPQSASPVTDRLGIPRAPSGILASLHSDPLRIIGTFNSTVPS
ncbi:MAG TPA: hypothetical protein VF898_08260 [Chloroflexota bacterium]